MNRALNIIQTVSDDEMVAIIHLLDTPHSFFSSFVSVDVDIKVQSFSYAEPNRYFFGDVNCFHYSQNIIVLHQYELSNTPAFAFNRSKTSSYIRLIVDVKELLMRISQIYLSTANIDSQYIPRHSILLYVHIVTVAVDKINTIYLKWNIVIKMNEKKKKMQSKRAGTLADNVIVIVILSLRQRCLTQHFTLTILCMA